MEATIHLVIDLHIKGIYDSRYTNYQERAGVSALSKQCHHRSAGWYKFYGFTEHRNFIWSSSLEFEHLSIIEF